MLNTNQNFVPILNTEAGLCLTAANWQEINTKTVSYYLDLLLLKPGYQLLKKITDLGKYLGWSNNLVINASRLIANKEGIVTLVSPYDGSKFKLTNAELVNLILSLKPSAILLPKTIMNGFPEIWDIWDDGIELFLSEEQHKVMEVPGKYGLYFNLDETKSSKDFLEQLKSWPHLPCYVSGQVTIDLIKLLKEREVTLIESDEPAKNAMHGIVYSREGEINLANEKQAMNFNPIDEECACPTCSKQLSRAYLHHLLVNTPLLCQRFLIQHNVYYAQGN